MNDLFLGSDSPIERVARSGGPPALRRRWLDRWAREFPGLARAIVSVARGRGERDLKPWELYENFLTTWEDNLEKALFLWGMGDRPSLSHYRDWGVEQFAEVESWWKDE